MKKKLLFVILSFALLTVCSMLYASPDVYDSKVKRTFAIEITAEGRDEVVKLKGMYAYFGEIILTGIEAESPLRLVLGKEFQAYFQKTSGSSLLKIALIETTDRSNNTLLEYVFDSKCSIIATALATKDGPFYSWRIMKDGDVELDLDEIELFGLK